MTKKQENTMDNNPFVTAARNYAAAEERLRQATAELDKARIELVACIQKGQQQAVTNGHAAPPEERIYRALTREGTSVGDLIRLSRISKGSVYWYLNKLVVEGKAEKVFPGVFRRLATEE